MFNGIYDTYGDHEIEFEGDFTAEKVPGSKSPFLLLPEHR